MDIYIVETKELSIKQILRQATIIDNDVKPKYNIGKNSRKEKILHVMYEYTKWDDEYPIVIFWDDLFNKLNEDLYLYTIQGEAFEDIKICGGYGYAYPVSYIEYNIDFMEE